jgi:HPt (histidine-containing phosphotransfer) domain-containing protein
MSEDPVLNPEAISALQAVSPDDGGQFFNELIDIFLSDTPERLQEIASGLENGDALLVMRAAHSIKGSAGNFGATGLAHAAYVIEQAARQADLATAAAGVAPLHEHYAKVTAALEAVRIRG